MDILRIIVFFTIVIVALITWRRLKNFRRPKNYKDMCICKHAMTAHISWANFKRKSLVLGKCSECDCPEFVLNKKAGDSAYFMREEGPMHRVSRIFARCTTMILVAFLPRHMLHDLISRLQDWARRLEKKNEERDKDDESTPLP